MANYHRPSYGGFRGQRPQNRSFSGPKPKYIHPSKYVNRSGENEETVKEIAITHSFSDFAVHEQLARNIASHGYTTPTPIQDQAIPEALLGKDVVGIANTGTGKTAAFLIPILHKIAMNLQEGALIVVPTRELAMQVKDECIALARGLRIGVVLCVGGMNIESQMRSLRDNPHIVIGTPGRLKDLIQRKALNTGLFTTIVLDEVDRMLDIGFRKDIQYLVSLLPEARQSLFFSATMTPDVESIMRSFLHDPVRISVKVRETSNHIDQDVLHIQPGQNKVDILTSMLQNQQEFQKVIVFGRTKHGINKLERILADRGLRVSAIHGNKSQGARQRALDQFKRGHAQALLATDVAARGIDIDSVSHVINFDEPNCYEDYIHRIGRTGRAGKVGKAITFVAQM